MAAVRARPLQMGMDLAHLATTRPFWRGQHFYGDGVAIARLDGVAIAS